MPSPTLAVPDAVPRAADARVAAAGSTKLPLALWLFTAVLAATVAAVLACTFFIDRSVRAENRRQALDYLQASADALRDALDRGMAQHYQEVRVIAQLDQITQRGNPAAVRRALDAVRSGFPQFAWLGLTDEAGVVIAASGGLLEGVDVSKRPWFTGGQGDTFVGDVHKAVLLEKLLPRQNEPWRFVDVATPVRDGGGKAVGVLGMHLSWEWAAQIKRELVDGPLAAIQAEALVLSADGTVLLGPPELQGRKLDAERADMLAVESRTHGSGRYPGLGWNVVLRQPASVAMSDYAELHTQMQFIALAVCLLLAPGLWALAGLLSRPLRQLTDELDDEHAKPHDGPTFYREADMLDQALQRHVRRQQADAQRLHELNAGLEARVLERTAQLAASERRLSELTDTIPAMVGYFDAQERCQFANTAGLRLQGLSRESARGLPMRQALGDIDYLQHEPFVKRALAGERTRFDGHSNHRGRESFYEAHLVPDRGPDGEVQGFYLMTFDVTRLKTIENRVRASERLVRTVTDNLPVLIAYFDQNERLHFLNDTYRRWLGIDLEAAVGGTLREAIGEELYAQRKAHVVRALAGERVEFEAESATRGTPRCVQSVYVPDIGPDGEVRGVFALTTDITALKAVERQLGQLARTDALTGLPNRHAFTEKLEEALARSRRSGQALALLFLDVDRFKSINDTHGHQTGDEVLRAFAQRLRHCVRETDVVARLAGDEFVVVLEGLASPEVSSAVARKILEAVNAPLRLADVELALGTSIGIAYETSGTLPGPALLARADAALYESKKAGRNTYRLAA